MKRLSVILLFFLTACVGIPENVEPVPNFNLKKYLGKWYEIARLDHSFERGLTHVTAEYSLRNDGGIKVINRGYSAKEKSWKEAEGKAYFVNGPDQGYLKVFFSVLFMVLISFSNLIMIIINMRCFVAQINLIFGFFQELRHYKRRSWTLF